MKTVHVLIDFGFESPRAEDAVRIVNKTKGLSYKLVPFLMTDVRLGSPQVSMSYFEFSSEELEEFKARPIHPVPEPTRTLQESMDEIERIATRYRLQYGVAQDELVIVLCNWGNVENFMVIPLFGGHQVAGIQLNHYAMNNPWSHTLLAYYLLALPVMARAYEAETLESYLARFAHTTVRGCINDLCADDVTQLQVKTKTGDICHSCKAHFQEVDLPWALISQMRQGFELVRSMQLNLEDMLDGFKLPDITLGRRPVFVELGITVPLNPKEMAVYCTFMEAGPEGIELPNMEDYRNQLHDTYSRLYTGSDREAMEGVVDRLVDPLDGSLQQTLSKVNKKFEEALGPQRAAQYRIHGPHGEAKAIRLPRQHVLRGHPFRQDLH